MKNENNNGQYWYGIGMVAIFLSFIGFVIYLLYTLVVKVSNNEFSNVALIQSLVSLFFTVVIGTMLSKSLDIRNAKQSELYKIKVDIAEKFVISAIFLLQDSDDSAANALLLQLQVRVKLFYKDDVLTAINAFMKTKGQLEFDNVVDLMRKEIK